MLGSERILEQLIERVSAAITHSPCDKLTRSLLGSHLRGLQMHLNLKRQPSTIFQTSHDDLCADLMVRVNQTLAQIDLPAAGTRVPDSGGAKRGEGNSANLKDGAVKKKRRDKQKVDKPPRPAPRNRYEAAVYELEDRIKSGKLKKGELTQLRKELNAAKMDLSIYEYRQRQLPQ